MERCKVARGCWSRWSDATHVILHKPRLRDRLRRHRVETARLALSLRPVSDWLKTKNPAAQAVRRLSL
jgi:hypothetical protein